MTAIEIINERPASDGYKVDVSRGGHNGRVSSEWFSRPDDERYLSLSDLYASVKGRAERSRTRTVESVAIRVEAHRDDPENLALILPEAARLSRLFHDASTVESGGMLDIAAPTGPQIDPQTVFPTVAQPGSEPNAVEQQQAFLAQPVDRRTTSDERLTDPVSPYVLQAGSVIRAALVTGLRSDLSGQIAAQVTQHVYDSPTGRFLLVPQGARLIGEHDSRVAFGQRRVLLIWNRPPLPKASPEPTKVSFMTGPSCRGRAWPLPLSHARSSPHARLQAHHHRRKDDDG